MEIKGPILFPTEFGPLAAKAESNALNLARLTGAKLALFHAIPAPKPIRLFSSHDENALRDKARQQLEQYRERIDPDHTTPCYFITHAGKPEQAIIDAARDLQSGLIIFGTKGGSGLKDSLLGSAVNHVIRHTPCPVFTIRVRPGTPGFKRILVPIDMARESGEQIGWAISLARLFGAEIFFYSLVDKTVEGLMLLDGQLKQAALRAKQAGIHEVESFLRHPLGTSIADEILSFAKASKADLICIMTQRESESGRRKPLLGSVADRLVNASDISVVSIVPGSLPG